MSFYRVPALFALALPLSLFAADGVAHAQSRPKADPRAQAPAMPPSRAATAPVAVHPTNLMSQVTLADIGFVAGFRFAHLGGRRDIFVPVPQASDVTANELVLVIDDISAHEARRSLEVMVNDRTAAAIALDGHSTGRKVHVPLAKTPAKDGFLKLTFTYSGAATADRCIDVRHVGDSVTIRPETAIDIDVGPANALDVAATAALMPRDVSIVLPARQLTASDIATTLTVARALSASGRRVNLHQGYETLADLAKRQEPRRWTRGLIVIGSLDEAAGHLDSPIAYLAGPPLPLGTLAAVRIGGVPALLISDDASGRASRLLASPSLSATRGIAAASVGDTTMSQIPTDRVTFDQLGIPSAQAEVFGRADLAVTIDTRKLPAGTQAARLLLDLMVAPDGAGEKAVVSVYVNERLVGSTVAAIGEPTRLDLPLPHGLVGTSASVRAVVQRRSAQGDCRFEPQGYPAQIRGSSSVVLMRAGDRLHDFSDLAARWSAGIEVLFPARAAEQPIPVLRLLAEVLNTLSPETAPITVKFVAPGAAPVAHAPFLALGDAAPEGSVPRVRFESGRVAVADRSGRTLLDLGGFAGGAVAQILTAGDHAGMWIKPLSGERTLPAPRELRLDHGDVAFLDGTGVALAMSTERDTVVRITYPDRASWMTMAEPYRPWIIGGLWALATVVFLLTLRRMLRRRRTSAVG